EKYRTWCISVAYSAAGRSSRRRNLAIGDWLGCPARTRSTIRRSRSQRSLAAKVLSLRVTRRVLPRSLPPSRLGDEIDNRRELACGAGPAEFRGTGSRPEATMVPNIEVENPQKLREL